VGVGGAGAVVPDVNVALVEGTAAGGKALPASGSAIAPALVVAGFGLLFGVGFGLWLAGRRRSAQAD
jgi:LPXTG-motif cell wall-anchored protein